MSWSSEFAQNHPRFASRYLTFDARSLGIARIYLGALLLGDLLRRAAGVPTWYSNAGLLPNHMLLWHPGAEYQFSLFFLASHTHEAAILFVSCGLVFFTFLVGYRTRLFHFLSLVCICSLHNRLILLDDGSETTTRLLTFWTLFLPMGRRYSIDSILRKGQSAGASAGGGDGQEVVSPAVPVILLQLAAIYVFNAIHKQGETWRSGSAVHYVLHQDRIVTWLGLLLRRHLTWNASKVLSWSALATEALLPFLLLTPVLTKYARRLAVLLGIGLHLCFAALLNLGMFSFNMIGFFLLLPCADDWVLLERFVRARPSYRAFVELASRLQAEVRKRVPYRAPSGDACDAPLANIRAGLGGAVLAVYAIAVGRQLLLDNAAVPAPLRVHAQPKLFRMLVDYPRLGQGWTMFAPDAPLTDEVLYADALTVDGRHVDPIGAASRGSSVPPKRIPPFMDLNDAWCDYMVNIVGRDDYYPALRAWIFAYPERTGRPEDAIVDVDVGILEDDSPPPNHTEPTRLRRKVLFHATAR